MREPDGESSLWASISTTTAYLLDEQGVEYDYENFKPVIGYPDGGVVYVSDSTGISEPNEILEAEEELVYGGTSVTGLPLTILLSFEVLGLDVDGIFGYEAVDQLELLLNKVKRTWIFRLLLVIYQT